MTVPIAIANALSAFSITLLFGVSLLDFGHGTSRNVCVEEGAGDLQDGDMNFLEDLPSDWKIVTANDNARGWKMTGLAKCSLVGVESQVVKIMDGHGLSLMHRVDDDGDGKNVLIEFASKNGVRIMWMLWQQSMSETGFSWGVSK